MKKWTFEPAEFIPFRDVKAIEWVTLMRDQDIEPRWVADMFYRIKSAADEGRRCVLITPNPARCYMKVAYLINKFKVDCKHVWTFNMDEYANEDRQTPPLFARRSCGSLSTRSTGPGRPISRTPCASSAST